jgi:hypothetical protein
MRRGADFVGGVVFPFFDEEVGAEGDGVVFPLLR